MPSPSARSWSIRVRALLAAAALTIAVPASTGGAHGHPQQAPKVSLDPTVVAAGGRVIGLINSGQTFDGETFEGIPDGLGMVPVGNGKRFVDIYVAFEQSHVPFGVPPAPNFADFEDSSVQRARLDLKTMQIVDVEEVLPASEGYIRFCSAFMAGPEQGFGEYTFFVNEESNDVLDLVPGAQYGPDPGLSGYRQAGYSVWIDTKTGDYKPIPGMGRHNHENTVIIPGGWSDIISLSGDDTFTAPSSQLYMYTAANPGALKQDKGSLWAFQVTGVDGAQLTEPQIADPLNNLNDYLEILAGHSYQGRFIPVPDDVADGTTGIAPQTALENWSNTNNVFQFVRVEDIDYDPDNPREVYFADTGTTRLKESTSGANEGRLFRAGATGFPYFDSDGRVFKMVMNASDPTRVDSLSILAQGRLRLQEAPIPPDTAPIITVLDPGVGFVNPDNLDISTTSLMVQEDSASANDVWQNVLGSPTWSRVASTTQIATAETSGIVDASAWLGAGWWILDVQSHVNQSEGPGGLTYITPITGVPLSYNTRREDGQLLLMFIPGS